MRPTLASRKARHPPTGCYSIVVPRTERLVLQHRCRWPAVSRRHALGEPQPPFTSRPAAALPTGPSDEQPPFGAAWGENVAPGQRPLLLPYRFYHSCRQQSERRAFVSEAAADGRTGQLSTPQIGAGDDSK